MVWQLSLEPEIVPVKPLELLVLTHWNQWALA